MMCPAHIIPVQYVEPIFQPNFLHTTLSMFKSGEKIYHLSIDNTQTDKCLALNDTQRPQLTQSRITT